jgi:Inorganic Pyrophosphatase/C-terminal domain on Strawberry notch homologue
LQTSPLDEATQWSNSATSVPTGNLAADEANVAVPTGDVLNEMAAGQQSPGDEAAAERAQAFDYKVKGEDLARRGIGYYTDLRTGEPKPITDASGAAITNFDQRTGIGYDSHGNPQKMTFNAGTGAPQLQNPYDTATPFTDKTGNIYKAPAGLPWQFEGVDQPTAAAAQAATQQNLDNKTAALLTGPVTMAKQRFQATQQAVADSEKQTAAKLQGLGVPTVDAQGQPLDLTNTDPNQLRGTIESSFSNELAAPQANDKPLWGSGLTDSAQAVRDDIANRKQQALGALSDHVDQVTAMQKAGSDYDAARAPLAAINVSRLNAINAQRTAAGMQPVPIPDELQRVAALAQPQGQAPPSIPGLEAHADTQHVSAAVAPDAITATHSAVDDAKAGNKLYGYDDNAGVQFKPENMADGLKQAVQDNLIDPQWAAQHAADFQKAQDQYQQLEKQAGGAQVLKALVHGGGLGAAFLAGAEPGAKLGALGAAAIPGLGETGIAELVGGAIGGLTTGSIATFAAKKLLDKAGQYSDTVQSLNAAAQLHPVADSAGQLVAMAANAPQALSNTFRAAKIASSAAAGELLAGGADAAAAANAGRVAALKMAGKIMGGGAAGGALFTAAQPVFDYASNAVADVLGIKHDAVQSPTLQALATNVGLGIITAGHNIEFKDYSAGQVASVLVRAQVRNIAGVPLDAAVQPADLAEAATKAGLDMSQAANAQAPLSKAEIDLYNSIGKQMTKMRDSGKYDDATLKNITATQALIPEFGKKEGTPLTSAAIETEPGKGGGQQEPTPGLGAPPEKPVSGRVVEPSSPAPKGPAAAPDSSGEPQAPAADGKAPTVIPSLETEAAAHEAATSQLNDLAAPTEAQKEAGNYQKGHVKIGGLDVSIENPAGSQRATEWPALTAHYGYVKGSVGADGDHIDTFVKPNTPTDYDGPVYVVNHNNPDGTFDEHKAVIGADSAQDALAIHNANYTSDHQAKIGDVATFSSPATFKDWATGASRRTAPAKGDVSKPAETDTKPVVKETKPPETSESSIPGIEPEPQPLSADATKARDLARAAIKAHADKLSKLGHPAELVEGPVSGESGLAYDFGDQRIHADPEKLARSIATVRKANPKNPGKAVSDWVHHAVAEEVIHAATDRWMRESPDNQTRLESLTEDKEAMARAGKVYGPAWDGLSDTHKAMEYVRMLIQGKERLTERAYRILKDFLKWLENKLGKLTGAEKEVVDGIKARMGEFEKEQQPTKENAPPAESPKIATLRNELSELRGELHAARDAAAAGMGDQETDAEISSLERRESILLAKLKAAGAQPTIPTFEHISPTEQAKPAEEPTKKEPVTPKAKISPKAKSEVPVKESPATFAERRALSEKWLNNLGPEDILAKMKEYGIPAPHAQKVWDKAAKRAPGDESDYAMDFQSAADDDLNAWEKKAYLTPAAKPKQLSPEAQMIKDVLGDMLGAAEPKPRWPASDYKEAAQKSDEMRIAGKDTPERPVASEKELRAVYASIAKSTGFPDVPIADVLEKANFAPVGDTGDRAKGILMSLAAEGKVQLWAGDWSLADDRERAWAVFHSGGDPQLLMRFNAEQLASAAPPSYDATLPPEKMPAMIGLAQKLAATVKTPEDLAQKLSELGAKGQALSQALWHMMKAVGAKGASDPDWASIYGQKVEEPEQRTTEDEAKSLATHVSEVLAHGSLDRRGLTEIAKLHPLLSQKQVDEAAEAGIVMRARKLASRGQKPEATFDNMLSLYERQPNLTAKTSTSKINQAYSTPMPLAYVASELAKVTKDTTVFEPTAGNGALLLQANPDNTIANEMDPSRAAALKAQGFNVRVGDAMDMKSVNSSAERVVENPPFGTVKEDNGENKKWTVDGLTTDQIDHAIALHSLKNMADDGRSVLIIGGSQAIDRNARRSHYGTGERAEFFKKLYAEYGVIDHFTVNGDLYKKQGAGWPVDVITIAGRKPSPIQLPNVNPPRILNSWEELKNELNRTDQDRIAAGQYDEAKDRGELGDALAGIRAALDTGIRTLQSGNVPQSPGGTLSGTDGGSALEPAGDESKPDTSEAILPATSEGEGRLGDGPLDSSGHGQRGLKADQDKTDETKPKFHEKYVPVAKGPSFDIETPANIAAPQRNALEAIEREVGKPLAEFVRGELGYKPGTDIGKYFAAEQTDAIASAIHNLRNGGALILGDMTGVGKGRVVAALMEWAKRNDILPIFVTKNDTLYSAMLGDFHNIEKSIAPLYTKNGLDIVHPVTNEPVKTGSMAKTMDQIAATGKLPPEFDSVFTSYDQIGKDFDPDETGKDRQALLARGGMPLPGRRTKALNALVNKTKALLLLDESHLGAGSSIQGRRIMQLLGHKGALAYYSSATFAKRPDAMPLYFKTNLSRAADNPEQLQEVFKNGGAVMQAVASRMLAQDGQYIRRERTYDGIPFQTHINTDTAERDTRLGDEYTRGLRRLLDMSNRVKAATKSLNDIMVRQGKKMDVPVIKMEAADFASDIHNFISQYLLAIKTEGAIKQAIQAIKKGHALDPSKPDDLTPHKVVITVQNTMEAPISKLVVEGRELKYSSILQSNLEKLRRVKTKGSEARGDSEYVTIGRKPATGFENRSDENLIQDLVKVVSNTDLQGTTTQVGVVNEPVAMELFRRMANPQFLAAEEELGGLDLGNMPLSPIDHIRQSLEAEGIKTGEITGRSIGLDKEGNLYNRPKEDYSKRGQLKAMSDFNNTDLDALVLNASGSTGISLHSGKDFKNKAPRQMIVLQPHLDINEFMQTLGRILRSGQVHKPRYMLLQTALPAELRPAAILGQKMGLLNANTTSNVDSQVSEGAKTVDIFNEYGDEVVHKYLSENPVFTRDLQFPKIMGANGLMTLGEIGDLFDEDGKFARAVTSYAGIMPVYDQERMWDDVIGRYSALINYLDQLGENKLKASAADLGAETIDTAPFTPGRPGGKSVFDSPSNLERVSVKPKTKPFEPSEVLEKASTANSARPKTIADYKKDTSKWIDDYMAKLKERTAADLFPEKASKERERLRDQYNEVWAQLSRLGDAVTIATGGGKKVGAIIGVDIDPDFPITPSKQIFEVANNTLKRVFKIPASQMQERVTTMPKDGFEVAYNASREDKQQRHIITGNLVAASAKLGGTGQVTLYTKADGSVATGILLPGGFDPNAVNRVNVKDVHDALRVLSQGVPLTGDMDKVQVVSAGGRYILTVPASKAGGGKYWQDRGLNAAMIGGQFEQRGAVMRGEIGDLGNVIGILDRLGSTLGYVPQTGGQIPAATPGTEGAGGGESPAEPTPSEPPTKIQGESASPENTPATTEAKSEGAKLIDEADRVGVSYSLETLKALIRGDKSAMDRVRGQIAEKGGQLPAAAPSIAQTILRKTPGLDVLKSLDAGIRSLVAVTTKSPEHLKAAQTIVGRLGPTARKQEADVHAGAAALHRFNKMGVYDERIPLEKNPGITFMSAMATGKPMSAGLTAYAIDAKAQFDYWLDAMKAAGVELQTVRDHYFPGMWRPDSRGAWHATLKEFAAAGKLPAGGIDFNNPDPALQAAVRKRVEEILASGEPTDPIADMSAYMAKRPMEGKASFRKEKVFDDIMSGIMWGLKPVTPNPIEMKNLKLGEMGKFTTAHQIFGDFYDQGNMVDVGNDGQPMKKALRATWDKSKMAKIDDAYGTIWRRGPNGELIKQGERWATKPVAEVLNNYLSAGLYNNQYFGKLYKAWMGFANVLNQSQLGWGSGFHAGFTAFEAQVSALTNLVQDVFGLLRGTRSMKQLAATAARVGIAIPETVSTGNKVLNAYLDPTGTADPRIAQVVRLWELTGGHIGIEKGLQTDALNKMEQEWFGGHKIKAALRSPLGLLELLSKPIMTMLVPRMKLGVFAHEAWRLIEANPGKTMEELAPEANKIRNRIDGRLGQVDYQRLFMHGVAKNIIQGGIRAPGWSGGTVTTILGGFRDIPKFFNDWRKNGEMPKELPPNFAYLLTLALTGALVNGMLTYAFTGEHPHGTDYLAFRTGKKDEAGNDERFMMPSYLKDLWAYSQHAGQTIMNKTHPIIGMLHDLIKNQDYYGTEIRNPDAGPIKQAGQVGKYVVKQFEPFWVRGYQKEAERRSGTLEKALPLFGVTPAPKEMNQTKAERLASEISRANMPSLPSTEQQTERRLARSEATVALRQGDTSVLQSELREGKLRPSDVRSIQQRASLPPLVSQVKSLPLEQAERVYALANTKERVQLQPIMQQKRARSAAQSRQFVFQ